MQVDKKINVAKIWYKSDRIQKKLATSVLVNFFRQKVSMCYGHFKFEALVCKSCKSQ